MTNETDPRLDKFIHIRGIAQPPPSSEIAKAANAAARDTLVAAAASTPAALGKRFCDNPKCLLHSHPASGQRHIPVWEIDRTGKPYLVTRAVGHSILRAGQKEIRLCHVCAEAVKMAIAISDR